MYTKHRLKLHSQMARKQCVCVCLLLVRAKAKIKGNKYGATRSAGDYRRKVQLARLCALDREEGGGRDVYYERERKPKESIIKYEATRSEGDYRWKVLPYRSGAYFLY